VTVTNQVPATWFAGDAGIRRLASLCATAPQGAVAAFSPGSGQAGRPLHLPAGRSQLALGFEQGAEHVVAGGALVPRRDRGEPALDLVDGGGEGGQLGAVTGHRRSLAWPAGPAARDQVGLPPGSARSPGIVARDDPAHPPPPIVLTRLDLRGHRGDLAMVLPRPQTEGTGPVAAVEAILRDVQARGDAAVRELTARFDGVERADLRVPPAELDAALARIPAGLREALGVAHEAVVAHHRHQVADEVDHTHRGVRLRARAVPMARAGCYVPGGRAVYPSTVVMTAAIAKVAGVAEVVLCIPPDRSTGRPPDASLAAAALCGVDEVYAIGGAQAVAALAYGTESIRPVDVIVGPGNVYVALAKRLVAGEGRVAVPSSFAGPSEVVVVADASAPPTFAAIDVLVQAEHGPDGLAWLVSWDEQALETVTAEVARLTAIAPRRADIEANLGSNGYAVLCESPEQAMAVANAVAPEHLELMVADPEALLALVRNAGAVFTGPWSPASLGDYVAGPSHVLPTFGSARFSSALTVADFVKQVHVVSADEAALRAAAPYVEALAVAEGLAAHADSMRLRTGTVGP